MKAKLILILIAMLLPLAGWSQSVQLGVGVRTSLLGYTEDELDSTKMFWGGHGRLMAFKYFAGEVSIQKRDDNFNVGNGNIRLDTVPLQVSAVVFPLAMLPVSPYFVVGTGWYFLTATISGDLDLPFVTGEGSIDHTETAYHVGVGVEGFIGKHFSVGADVRKIFLDFETSIISYSVDAYFVNVGATFYF